MLTWFVNYKDGTRHDYVSKVFDISHIDSQKLDTFVLHDPNEQVPILVIHFDDPRKRMIYVRRTELPGRISFTTICHIVGWQMKVSGENIQSLSYVFETKGRVIKVKKMVDNVEIQVPQREEKIWIENAGKFDRKRNSWFQEPSPKQLKVIGSKVNSG